MADDDDWGDDDDDWGDDNAGGEEEWGDEEEVLADDAIITDMEAPPTKKAKIDDDVPKSWKCLECGVVHNTPPSLICFSCGKTNLNQLNRMRREFEKKECEVLSDLMEKTYSTYYHHVNNGLDLDSSYVDQALQELFKACPVAKKADDADAHKTLTTCMILLEDFDDGEHMQMEMTGGCQHAMCCKSCLRMYIQNLIEDGEDVIPWVVCPADSCTEYIPLDVFMAAEISTKHKFQFVTTVLGKKLLRNDNWIQCCNDNCLYGFAEYQTFEGKKDVTCEVCYTEQQISRDKGADEGFYEMVKAGTIRLCPMCDHPHIKDKGMCNIMQCPKCSIWWNWDTKATAKRQAEMKAKARQSGTLWGKGELEYQRNLERNDPEGFKALLRKNGIIYDPNYRRGT